MAITISGSGITSANIADGTITNGDIHPSAAIDGSKLSGASLTNIPAANITGALPAISGANLTGLAASFADLTDTTVSTVKPTESTNPSALGHLWINTTTGEQFTATDITTGANRWIGSLGGLVPEPTIGVFDIFEDSSAVALFQLNDNVNDTGGTYANNYNSLNSYSAGKFGTAPNFSSHHIRYPINNNVVKSVSCWIKPNSFATQNAIWSSGKQQNGTARQMFYIQTSGKLVSGYSGSFSGDIGNITLNVWTHLAFSNNKFYINGALAATLSGTLYTAGDTYGFYIGANGAYDYGYVHDENYGSPFDGQIDQFRVFNRALTASEVAELYNEE
jgi:hypothetical protein